MKNNPLVATLQEAAGDCLDDKGCQDAAKKVVKLMTVVNTELEKKRLKDQEELKGNKQRVHLFLNISSLQLIIGIFSSTNGPKE